MFGHGETVIRIPFLGVMTDRVGDEAKTYGSEEEVHGVGFVELQSDEDSWETTSPAKMYVPFGQDAHEFDQWICRGITYEQEGVAKREVNPITGWQSGAVVRLRRVTG